MQTNPWLVLLISAVISLAMLVLKFFIYNPDNDFSETIRVWSIMVDVFKDIAIVAYVLYYMLYGVVPC